MNIIAVFDSNDVLGAVYTAGCHEVGIPELIVYDVPRIKVESLAGLLNYARTCTLDPNETIQSHGLIMVTKAVKGAALKTARAVMTKSDPKAKVLKLLPGVLGPTPEDWADANLAERLFERSG